jgi:hypothetical protein
MHSCTIARCTDVQINMCTAVQRYRWTVVQLYRCTAHGTETWNVPAASAVTEEERGGGGTALRLLQLLKATEEGKKT